MKILKEMLSLDSEFCHAAAQYREGRTPILVNGVCESVRPLFCVSFSERVNEKPLIIVSDEKQAYSLKNEIESYGEEAVVLPARDCVFDDMTASSKDFEQERLAVLSTVLNDGGKFIIAVPDALMQYTVPPDEFIDSLLTIRMNSRISPDDVVKRLVSIGYSFADTVEGKGQFTHRGGIIDVFSPSAEYPCRIDFFGDEPDSMGIFDTITQRRIENVDSYTCVPVCETVFSDETLKKTADAIDSLISSTTDEKVLKELRRDRESIASGRFPGGRDKYFSLLYGRKATFFDYVGTKLTVIIESRKVFERARAFSWQINQTLEALVNSGRTEFAYSDVCMFEDTFMSLTAKRGVALDYFMESSRLDFTSRFTLATKAIGSLNGGADMITDELSDWLEAGRKILFVTYGETEAENLASLLESRDMPSGTFRDELVEGRVNIAIAPPGSDFGGFDLQKANFVLLTTGENAAARAYTAKRSTVHRFKKAEKIASYSDLAVGDYVVHANHGIGIYDGLKQLTVEGAVKDYIKINYAGGDVLYVPCGQLDLVSKYIGAEKGVKISRMGTSEWARTKAKAKAAAKDIAKELIKLYAERKKTEGYAFMPDGEYQEEFEAMFEYTETEGQLDAAAEIKADMEKPVPMDRLLCGDVGFGKTEVALRAVFKCVQEGKQAAILVPTTLLALQHYRTILSRFRQFPVETEMLSRFVSKKETDDALARIESGKVDIIVGTHKILQKSIKFHDLGLLVVDEEQRFGVKHKETLKEMAKNVDVLTLTATPIPRTLNMALTGIRDMSVLEEAPRDRAPVQSYVLEHDDGIIYEAIRRELRRGGQVFYLHNFVDSIYKKAQDLQNAFPDSTVAIGHGQMSKDELASVWQAMVNGEIDILVCTTIIETGVDVPNANTLIIESADRMGLSQLHQIRGRVGRSPRKAYAYFTYRRDTILSEDASKRLEAISEFTEFGSGFKIAMRDLEIRGAGNLLGSEQSGHMQAIGYDLYVKILEEAVNEEKGIPPAVRKDCLVDITCDAYIPDDYVTSPKTRIDFYRKIALLDSEGDRDDLVDEFVDRFGDIPKPVENLMDVSLCRNIASGCDIVKISQSGLLVSFYVKEDAREKWLGLLGVPSMKGRLLGAKMTGTPYFSYKLKYGENPIEKIRTVLTEYSALLTNIS